MMDTFVADNLFGHLTARATAIVCIALELDKVAQGERRDEILRETGEMLLEAGSILIPWRTGLHIACWGELGDHPSKFRHVARVLLELREWAGRPGSLVTLRISLDVCEPGVSAFSQRQRFSEAVSGATRMTFSGAMEPGAWLVSSRAEGHLETELCFQNLAGPNAAKPWRSVIGRKAKEPSFLPPDGLEWVPEVDMDTATSQQAWETQQATRGLRELSLAECVSAIPIVLAR